MKIRSITVLSQLTLPPDADDINRLGAFAQAAREAFEAAGYEVQTTRLATDLFPTLAQPAHADHTLALVQELEATCQAAGFAYLALGPAGATLQAQVPELLSATESVFATAHIAAPNQTNIDGESVRRSARIMRKAAAIEEGFGNLRFAALANVPPGTPFFPGAYWPHPAPAFAIATESADLAVDACSRTGDLAGAHAELTSSVERHATALGTVAADLSERYDVAFHGIDFSLAPYPDPAISIGAALERLTGLPLGATGTLTAAATLTDALQAAQYPHAGFCGLFVPVLEDPVLAQRAAEGRLTISQLLQWSAVCGTGLDTVPLPGDASEEALSRVLFDVAALALRLGKPLTARLMPLPGKQAGDAVHFDFPYFADAGVLALDEGHEAGPLAATTTLSLRAYNRSPAS